MAAFEITAIGFDAGTDLTDDRVLWVWCKDEKWLRDSLKGAKFLNCSPMEQTVTPDEFDFIMPKDVQALHDRLYALANIPLLRDMQRGTKYRRAGHPEYGEVTFVASDPDDGAYLVCKYWCTEDDAQKYFGCEASDLRFIKV